MATRADGIVLTFWDFVCYILTPCSLTKSGNLRMANKSRLHCSNLSEILSVTYLLHVPWPSLGTCPWPTRQDGIFLTSLRFCLLLTPSSLTKPGNLRIANKSRRHCSNLSEILSVTYLLRVPWPSPGTSAWPTRADGIVLTCLRFCLLLTPCSLTKSGNFCMANKSRRHCSNLSEILSVTYSVFLDQVWKLPHGQQEQTALF